VLLAILALRVILVLRVILALQEQSTIFKVNIT
jgi:hypothetical protein